MNKSHKFLVKTNTWFFGHKNQTVCLIKTPFEIWIHFCEPIAMAPKNLKLFWRIFCYFQLICTRDSLLYLGETSKTAETRFVGHLNTVLQDCHSATNTPVGQHFCSVGHSHTDIQVTPFEKNYSRNPFIRKAREAHLIDKHELLTRGLNKKL